MPVPMGGFVECAIDAAGARPVRAGNTMQRHCLLPDPFMNDRNLLRGLFLLAISLSFGLASLRYPIGQLNRAGPGLFPLLVSSLLFLIGLITVIQSRFVERMPLDISLKNIAIVIASLCAFALVSRHVNMIAGITVMVFVASFAGTATWSVLRNLKIAAGLIAVALAFQKLLGFNLPLY